MRGVVMHAAGDVRVQERAEPRIVEPTDAVIRLTATCEIDVTFDVFELPGEPGLSIATYSVEEGSPSAEKFALLASWAATQAGPRVTKVNQEPM